MNLDASHGGDQFLTMADCTGAAHAGHGCLKTPASRRVGRRAGSTRPAAEPSEDALIWLLGCGCTDGAALTWISAASGSGFFAIASQSGDLIPQAARTGLISSGQGDSESEFKLLKLVLALRLGRVLTTVDQTARRRVGALSRR